MRDQSLGAGWTSFTDLTAAATDRGVLLEVLDIDGRDEHDMVVVNAHGGRWAVHREQDSTRGWCAIRLTLDGGSDRATLGWLGAAGAPAADLLAALLDHDALLTDVHGREPKVVMTAPRRRQRR